MGTLLHQTFIAAGLPEPTLRLESVLGAGTAAIPCLELIGNLMPIVCKRPIKAAWASTRRTATS